MNVKHYCKVILFAAFILFLSACAEGDGVISEPTNFIVEPPNPTSGQTVEPVFIFPEHTSVIPTDRPDIVSTPGSVVYINVVDDAFFEHTVTIPVGTTVVWIHKGTSGEPHTVTTDDGILDSHFLIDGNSYTHTFNNPGSYPYYCIPHRGDMDGLIIVIEE